MHKSAVLEDVLEMRDVTSCHHVGINNCRFGPASPTLSLDFQTPKSEQDRHIKADVDTLPSFYNNFTPIDAF